MKSADAPTPRGFTLLEVMIATLIISLLAFTLFRFVSANLQAMHATTELQDERETVQAVVRFVEAQLADLPRRQNGVILGNPLKIHDLPSDELIWRTHAGQGVLTAAAPGEYRVTMTVQPVEGAASEYELGLRREPVTDEARGDLAFFARGSGASKYNWISLVRPMAGFEVRYWDPRLNAWLDRWTDQAARPLLVRVRLWKNVDDTPIEAVLSVPSGRMAQP
ncbi:MAG: prepilin-type N-terminal cleavage/methylation domain-containing protein [Chthoniobacter sp.]|nr:prepilin-type N-terminal cleavage/methylation domain-containing protein [Chthoniobacter sp.]